MKLCVAILFAVLHIVVSYLCPALPSTMTATSSERCATVVGHRIAAFELIFAIVSDWMRSPCSKGLHRAVA
ncbi:hypothetical protein BU25DRAFT_414738 [Macroventuria anomochaeta]|uniref:Uncharacterized protein n=1 Tax=Macroventuria anomochaeta TaxID=301207 RepID=A0ACB6RPV6_9PLEO|nr:uncharacterized protein BU25DRAFT_414738 [Macroventuria anomochaeta]KAF2622972.1 hypothetical protein BU25DRAFT_414738 [Macroventuria anomochaeta]